MADNPTVSILIPLFNAEAYIAETLDSCLAQTYPYIEIIIVDDGSQDKSLDIAKEFEKKYQNIKVYAQENSGASSARNKAFNFSTGEYIQYLDADDLLHPDKIRLQLEVLKKCDDKALSFGRWGTFNQSIENVDWKELPVNTNYDNPIHFLTTLWASGMTVVIYAWLFPRRLIEESAGWDEKISVNDDGEFSARIVAHSSKLFFIKESKGYYRKDNENSLSKQVSKKALESNLNSFETYYKLMEDNLDNTDVKRSLALVYSRFLYTIPPCYKDLILKSKGKINNLGYAKPLNTFMLYERVLASCLGTYRMFQLKKMIKKMIL
ncbi:MAG TPA: glycosyltransferase family 2 protein [Sulfurovum sp.]|nr:glycosyltransferase family 2 protein [Sulfurovum sp.]